MNQTFAAAVLALSASPVLAGVSDDVSDAKRWYEPSFVFEVANTSSTVERDSVAGALGAAASVWNAVGAGPEITVVPGTDQSVTHPVALDGVNRVGVWSSGPWPYPAMAGAVTLVYTAKGSDQIAEVDIALNPAFAWTLNPLAEQGKYDLENILTHEMGHALGLPDVKDLQDATMFFMVQGGETLKRDLSEGDTAMLLELYEGIDANEPATGCNQAGKQTPATMMALLTLLAAMRAGRRST